METQNYPVNNGFLEMIDDWPVEKVAVGYTDGSGEKAVAGLTQEQFDLASVTKPLFAYSILVAIEEETLNLDQPAGPPHATIGHLLSHSSGLAIDEPKTIVMPGNRRIYSNAGFEALGQALHEASGLTSATYLAEAVTNPLGMTNTQLRGSEARGAVSTVDDLLLFAQELLQPTLISPETLKLATTPHLEHLDGILPGFGRQTPNPWGLGFEIRGNKTPHWTSPANSARTFGHFGASGTFLWVDPETGLAATALTDRKFGEWAPPLWNALSDAILSYQNLKCDADG